MYLPSLLLHALASLAVVSAMPLHRKNTQLARPSREHTLTILAEKDAIPTIHAEDLDDDTAIVYNYSAGQTDGAEVTVPGTSGSDDDDAVAYT